MVLRAANVRGAGAPRNMSFVNDASLNRTCARRKIRLCKCWYAHHSSPRYSANAYVKQNRRGQQSSSIIMLSAFGRVMKNVA